MTTILTLLSLLIVARSCWGWYRPQIYAQEDDTFIPGEPLTPRDFMNANKLGSTWAIPKPQVTTTDAPSGIDTTNDPTSTEYQGTESPTTVTRTRSTYETRSQQDNEIDTSTNEPIYRTFFETTATPARLTTGSLGTNILTETISDDFTRPETTLSDILTNKAFDSTTETYDSTTSARNTAGRTKYPNTGRPTANSVSRTTRPPKSKKKKPTTEEEYRPTELNGLFDGDIISMYQDLHDFIEDRYNNRHLDSRWHDGEVPYEIENDFNEHHRSVIAKAIGEFHKKTCIRFKPRTIEEDFVRIKHGKGCNSYVGLQGGPQNVNLNRDHCFDKLGTVIHQLMHAIGLWHEEMRVDRDEHVKINWNHVKPSIKNAFQMCDYDVGLLDVCHTFTPYDLDSVMHSPQDAFAKDRRYPTITPLLSRTNNMGQRDGFSERDIQKVNNLYECKGPKKVTRLVTPDIYQEDCEDLNLNCWKFVDDHCFENMTPWMHVNCPDSCEICDNECSDANPSCQKWASFGACKKVPEYMSIYCPKSCSTCPVTSAELAARARERAAAARAVSRSKSGKRGRR